ADENKIIQITSNLLSNALKFTEKGSVNLKISKLKSNILKIEVQDSGMGISPENQKVLFSKFTQLDQSSNKKIGGTGLGLAISKELTKLLGGEITLTSTLGKGSN